LGKGFTRLIIHNLLKKEYENVMNVVNVKTQLRQFTTEGTEVFHRDKEGPPYLTISYAE
jgi:hypothetical protein